MVAWKENESVAPGASGPASSQRMVPKSPSAGAETGARIQTGHDLDLDAPGAHALELLAAGVTVREPHDALALIREAHNQIVDFGLAYLNQGRVASRPVQDFRAHEFVVDHHVGLLQQPQRAQRQQVRVARPGADEMDDALAPAPAVG